MNADQFTDAVAYARHALEFAEDSAPINDRVVEHHLIACYGATRTEALRIIKDAIRQRATAMNA